MSLKSTFFALKKIYKLSKLGEAGGGDVIWTKSKRRAVFFGIKGRHQKLLNGFFQLRKLFWAA